MCLCSNDPGNNQKCCWISIINLNIEPDPENPGAIMRFFTEINLNKRPSDAAVKPDDFNTSPVTDIIPILPARAGCEHRLFIPNADSDFDSIRCRWAEYNTDTFKDECGSVCHALDQAPYNALLNEVSSR